MSEENTVGRDVPEANQGTSQRKESQVTLKYVVNRTHIGPVPEIKKAKKLSKAAAKIKLDSDLRFDSSNPTGDENDKAGKGGSLSYSVKIKEGDSASAKVALIIVEAWARLYQGVGTSEYVEKYNALNRARTEAYAELGIPYQPGQKAPLLTEEQRVFYNKRLLPFAFDYWEHRISYKVPRKKAVRTKTYRSLQQMSWERVRNNLKPMVTKVNELFKFTEVSEDSIE